MRRSAAVGVAVLVVVLAGCGASGGIGSATSTPAGKTTTTATAATGRPSSSATGPIDRDAYREALTAFFVMDPDDGAMRRCIDEQLADAFDIDAIADSGVVPAAIADGGFLTGLDFSPEEESTLAATAGDAMLECGSTRALIEYILTSADEGAVTSDAGLDCAAETVAGGLGEAAVTVAIDPDADLLDDVDELLAVALASCPEFAADAIESGTKEGGHELTPEERACLVEEFTASGTDPRSAAEISAIVDTCIDT